MRWVRAAELSCDRAALLVAGDPKVVVSVLMKLSGGCPKLARQLNVDAFLDQARGYDEASNSPLGWYLRNAQTRQVGLHSPGGCRVALAPGGCQIGYIDHHTILAVINCTYALAAK
jgi:hypothetical protein